VNGIEPTPASIVPLLFALLPGKEIVLNAAENAPADVEDDADNPLQ